MGYGFVQSIGAQVHWTLGPRRLRPVLPSPKSKTVEGCYGVGQSVGLE